MIRCSYLTYKAATYSSLVTVTSTANAKSTTHLPVSHAMIMVIVLLTPKLDARRLCPHSLAVVLH